MCRIFLVYYFKFLNYSINANILYPFDDYNQLVYYIAIRIAGEFNQHAQACTIFTSAIFNNCINFNYLASNISIYNS